jgi:hypothetical protein
MRPCLTLATGLLLVITLNFAARADPITGTVTLTVEPTTPMYGDGPGVSSPLVFSSGNVALGTLPQQLMLSGPPIGLTANLNGGSISETLGPVYNMTIAFNGAGGSHPTVNATGFLVGTVSEGIIPRMWSSFHSSSSASRLTVRGWTPASGIPQSLIDAYLDPAHYQFQQDVEATTLPASANLIVTVGSVPEPATIVVYVAGIAVLLLNRHAWTAQMRRKGPRSLFTLHSEG